jgi:signal recognition particle receptor subunit beta
MVQINFAHKEIQCKIVYYGPGMSGKTTNLELVHAKTPGESRGELTSIATTGERTLYFDYMPLDLGSIAGIRTKFQLYTVPGQIYYKSTRRLVLQGVDGIVFVADSSAAKLEENRESMRDLEENLREMGRALSDLPIVIQYNKRDLPDAMSVEDLEKQVNVHSFPHFEAIATTGQGIFPTLKALAALVLEAVNKGGLGSATRAAKPAATPAPVTATTPPATPAPAPVAARAPAPALSSSNGFGSPPPAPRPLTASTGFGSPPRTAVAASAPAPAVAVAPAHEAAATATLPAPARTSRPAPASAPTPAPAPAAAPAPILTARPHSERLVRVSGLGRPSAGSRVMLLVVVLALLGGAAWFAVTKLL